MKTPQTQGLSIFPGGSGAKANLVWGQGWLVTALGAGGHPGAGGSQGAGGAGSAACRHSPDALAAASLEGEMNSLLPSSVFSPEHLHSNWEIWAFSCFSARSCQLFPFPKRGLVFFFSLFFPLVLCNLLPAVHPVRALLAFYSIRSIWRDLPHLSHHVDPQEQIFPWGCSLVALRSPKLLYHSLQVFFPGRSHADLAHPAAWGAACCLLGAGQPLPKAGTGKHFEAAAGWGPPCSLFFPAVSGLARLALGWPGQLLAWQCPTRVRFVP